MIPISASTIVWILLVMFSVVPATGVFLFAGAGTRLFLTLFRGLAFLYLGSVLVVRFLRWGVPDYLHAPYFDHGMLLGYLKYALCLCAAGLPGAWLREARIARRKGPVTRFWTRPWLHEAWQQRLSWAQSLLITLTAATIWASQPIYPSDAALRAHFMKHRSELQQLVVLVGEDMRLLADRSPFPWYNIALVPLDPRISPPRAAIYRHLLRSLGADTTMVGIGDSLLFLDYAEVTWPDKGMKGYVYNYGHAPLRPLVASLDTRGPELEIRYRPLAPPWYLCDNNAGPTLW